MALASPTWAPTSWPRSPFQLSSGSWAPTWAMP